MFGVSQLAQLTEDSTGLGVAKAGNEVTTEEVAGLDVPSNDSRMGVNEGKAGELLLVGRVPDGRV